MVVDSVESLLVREEDEVLHAYPDSEGYWTIGVGILIDARRGGGITREESRFILNNRLNLLRQRLAWRYPWFSPLDEVRKAVVLSMAWQDSQENLLDDWPHFINEMAVRDYEQAAKEMLDSKVAREQAKARWERQAQMMRTGKWV